ncbi:hypothetical protein lerEdw1_006500 [Lerista edwardsae]|nr:hypothetical protein lerEdw1_006500 [Lerista edwardsae]
MLAVHDTVAQKNFDPVLPPLPENIDDDFDEESVKIVRLVKNKEPLVCLYNAEYIMKSNLRMLVYNNCLIFPALLSPLLLTSQIGATIRRDEHTGAVIVARIMRGGAADRSGLVHVGDELREVNGVAVLHKRPEEISQILAQSQGSITLKIIPAIKEEDQLKDSKVFMRALFSYNPKEDRAIPCQEAGLPFQRRHILEVVSQDDPTWWQAKRVGDTNLRAGLIPSKQFQERRLLYRRTMGTLHNTRSVAKPLYDQSSEKGRFLIYSGLKTLCFPYPHRCSGPLGSLLCTNTYPISLTPSPSHFSLLFSTEDCDCEGYFNGQYIGSLPIMLFSGFFVAGLRRSFRLSRKEKQNSQNEVKQVEPAHASELLTYEEVTKYQQQPGERKRLVVLIGSLGSRLNELKQKVVAENPQEYGVAVPRNDIVYGAVGPSLCILFLSDTTRSKKSHEKEGVEYNFVSKQSFETDVQHNK